MPNILPISGGGGGDSAFYTGSSTKSGTVHTITIIEEVDALPNYFAIECKFDSVYVAGDTISVKGASFDVYNTNNSTAPDNIFKAGVVDIIKFDNSNASARKAYITMPFAVYGG